MKICFIYYSVFSLGGIQRCVTELANYLSDNDNDIYIICTNDNTKVDREIYGLNKNVKIIVLKKPCLLKRIIKKFIKVVNNFLGIFNNERILKFVYNIYNKQISEILKKEKIDVIIGCSSFHNIAISMLKNKNLKKVGWQHNCFDRFFNTKNKDYYKKSSIVKKMFIDLDKYVVLTDDDKDKLHQLGYNEKIVRIYNPIRIEQTTKSSLKSKKFIAVGRFSKVKGFDDLIKNFKEFNKYNKEWKLDIIGEGAERKKIEKLVKKLKLSDYVRILNRTNNMKEIYINASIYCMTSYVEGLPMVILEAMENGLPIIIYELPFIHEIFTNESQGIIIKNRDKNKYVEAMLELAKNSKKREEISKKELERIRDFDIEIIGKQWKNLLKNI